MDVQKQINCMLSVRTSGTHGYFERLFMTLLPRNWQWFSRAIYITPHAEEVHVRWRQSAPPRRWNSSRVCQSTHLQHYQIDMETKSGIHL